MADWQIRGVGGYYKKASGENGDRLFAGRLIQANRGSRLTTPTLQFPDMALPEELLEGREAIYPWEIQAHGSALLQTVDAFWGDVSHHAVYV